MTARRRFVRNLLSLTSARMGVRLVNAVVVLIIARTLGSHGYGLYAAGFAFTALAAVLTDFGLNQVLLRAGARHHPRIRAYFGNALLVKGLLLVVAYAGMLGVSRILHHPPDLFAVIVVLGLSAMLTSGQQVFYSLFLATEEMHLAALAQAATSLLALAGAVTVALTGGSVLAFAWVQVAAAVLPLPWTVGRAARLVSPRPEPRAIPGLLREGVSFGLGNIFYLVNMRVDVVVMSSYLAASVIGIYAAAYRIVATVYFLPAVVSGVVIPQLYRYGSDDAAAHRRTSQTVLRYQSLFGGLFAAFLFLASGPLIRLLYGAGYGASAPLLRIICWLLVVQTVSFPLGDVLTTTDRNGQRVTVTGIAAAVNLAGNLLVIPIYGPVGAALVTLGTELATLLALGVLVWRQVPGFGLLRTLASQTIAVGLGILAGAAVLGLRPAVGWLEALEALAACGGVSLLLLLVLPFFGEPERRWLRARLQRS